MVLETVPALGYSIRPRRHTRAYSKLQVGTGASVESGDRQSG